MTTDNEYRGEYYKDDKTKCLESILKEVKEINSKLSQVDKLIGKTVLILVTGEIGTITDFPINVSRYRIELFDKSFYYLDLDKFIVIDTSKELVTKKVKITTKERGRNIFNCEGIIVDSYGAFINNHSSYLNDYSRPLDHFETTNYSIWIKENKSIYHNFTSSQFELVNEPSNTEPKPKTYKVKIIHCDQENVWYYNIVYGEDVVIFEVEEYIEQTGWNDTFKLVNQPLYILKRDCYVVSEGV